MNISKADIERATSAGVDWRKLAWRVFWSVLFFPVFWILAYGIFLEGFGFKNLGLSFVLGVGFSVCLFWLNGNMPSCMSKKNIWKDLAKSGVEYDETSTLKLGLIDEYNDRHNEIWLLVIMVLCGIVAVYSFFNLGKPNGNTMAIFFILSCVGFWMAFIAKRPIRLYDNPFEEAKKQIKKQQARKLQAETLFGKARVANLDELLDADFNPDSGLYVGEYVSESESGVRGSEHVFYGGDRHAVTIAPNGAGKGSTVLIPHQTHYKDGSLVVMDIKGENACITAQHRRDTLGQAVFILNPYGLFEDELAAQGFKPARFNPLASFDPAAKDYTLRIDTLAAELVPVHDERHNFWVKSSRQLVGGYLRFLVETKEPHERNICDVFGFFKRAQGGGDAFADELREVCASGSETVRNRLGCLLEPSEEIQKFLSTAVSDLEFMDDPALRESLTGDDFDFRDFKRKPSTLYIVAPPDGVALRDMWLRLVVASGVSLLGDVSKGRGLDTLFLLDEFPVLGHMKIIADRYTLLRGYGIRFWLVAQSLQLLRKHYGEQWETFLDNAGAAQFFGVNGMAEAEYISKRAGNRTVNVQSTSTSTGAGGNDSVNESLQGVPLWSVQDVLGLERDKQIIFAPDTGGFPILLSRFDYYKSPEYSGLNPNPYV